MPIAIASPSTLATVNTEKLRTFGDKGGWSGFFEGNLSLTRGNNHTFDLGVATRIQHEEFYPSNPGISVEDHKNEQPLRLSRDLKFLSVSIRRAENRSSVFADSGFAHLRWTRMWHPRTGSEVFTQYQYNEFQRLKFRQLIGAGTRILVSSRHHFRSAFGTGYMLEIEEITAPEGSPDEPVTAYSRWNNYLTLQFLFPDSGAQLLNTFYIQPRFSDPQDFRILNEGEIVFPVSKTLSFGTKLVFTYDSRPPQGVQKYDLSSVNSVRFSF